MWVKVTTLSFQCRGKLNFTTMPENIPIMLALWLMLARPYYAPNYAGIIRPSLICSLLTLSSVVSAAFLSL